MKSVFVATSLMVVLALASPLEKRWLATETDIYTVTVTATADLSAWTGGWQNWGGQDQPAPADPTTPPAWTPEAPATTEAPAPAMTGWGSDWSSAAPAVQTAAPVGDYAQAILDQHNNHRANHSVPDLAWSDDMANIAAQIAASCVYEHNTDAGGGGYGQNIGAGADPSGVPAMITNEMYNDELDWYPLPYGVADPDMSNFENWGHMSQIVWKSSTSVGCATQYCPGGLANTGSGVSPYFTVCNYSPAGNFGGQYGDNVLPPQGDAIVIVPG